MRVSRSKLYLAALTGMAVFGALVLIDVLRPGMFPPDVAIGAPLALAVCGMAVIALRPRGAKRVKPHDVSPQDFTKMVEERRKLAEKAAERPPRLPPE